MSNQMEENLLFVNNMDFYDKVSDDEFINAVFSFEISALEISTIEKEYSFKNKNVMKKLEEAVEKAYTKKLSEPRITFEWTLDDYKKVDANLLDFNEDF